MRNHIRLTGAPARGFSLVELLVSMTISLILLGGVLAVVYSSKVAYYENERVGRLQENGRSAIEILLRDMRAAGFPGCLQPIPGLFSIKNTLTNPDTLLWNLTQPVFGYDATDDSWQPAMSADATTLFSDPNPLPTPGNDIIVIRTVQTGAPLLRTPAQVMPTGDISVEKDPAESIRKDTPMVISDCTGAAVFLPTDVAEGADGTTAVLKHEASAGSPGNDSDDFKHTYAVGARVAPIVSIIYYIAPSRTIDGPALWRITGTDGTPTEVIAGAEAMQLRYGVDTNNDALIDTYLDASAITGTAWSNVISVSLAILIRSDEPNSPILDTRTYTMLSTVLPAFNDHYQRSLFTTTVTLRNRTS
ncbi:MAG: PilW family protein [Gammaproteobacteria bacterium]